jgi:transcriptional regulator with XRE-family HTH domain
VEKVEIERIGQRVRKVRKDMGLTLDQFSRRIGYSLNQVAVVEKAKSKPSDKLLRKVADVGRVRFRWLRYGDGEMLLEGTDLVDEKLIAWLQNHPDVVWELKKRSDWDKRITEDRIES